ncbi:hypothetical protein OH76DRAFT_1490890 [Lentinus brumalis]|uniref:Endonuclease/exonuclease/phosphatase domain-containing protein n=1 Tax=Lentinus brumalis TaxID=2498619 RepID=A0A371CHG0_9APHY|nr:hypothetical protein OH76DRAFT_1490890 [Polyporus brumalis]
MDVDEAAEQPHAQEHAVPPASKGKGKARATTAELEQPCGNNIATTDEPQEEWDGWDSSQLLAARQESLQQVLRDRGRRGGGHNHPDGQTAGAGPSGARYEPSRSRNGMTLYGLSTVREERASHGHEEHESGRRSRWTHQHDSDDFRMRENADRSGHPTYYGERARSEYVPMPDTRAGDYLANRGRGPVLQRSPASRLRGLRGTQSPPLQPLGLDSPFVPRKLANLCDEEPAMERRRHEDRWSEPDHEQDGRAGWEQRPDEEWDEEHRQQREDGEVLPTALWATALRDDAAPTPVPLEGYPTIHRDDPETALRGMAIEWMREVWSDPANTVVLVHVYNYRYTEDDALNRRVAEALRRAFETLTGESDFDVVPPETEDGERRRARDLPSAWAIRGLSPEGTAAAVERGTWSSQAISFVAAPRTTAMQTWLFALDGFLVGNEQKIRDAVLRILCEDDMWTWLREMVSANPSFAGMSATHAVNEVPHLMAGDFNNVEDALDRLPVGEGPDQSILALDELKEDLGLMLADGWRMTYPSVREYTFQRGDGRNAVFSRLDRIYIAPALFDNAREWRICDAGVKTDHSLVLVQLTSENAPVVGPGRPIFPLQLLKDKTLARSIRNRGLQAMNELELLATEGGRAEVTNAQTILCNFKRDAMKLARTREREVVPKLLADIRDTERALRATKASKTLAEANKIAEAAALAMQLRQLKQRRFKQQQQNSRATHRLYGGVLVAFL